MLIGVPKEIKTHEYRVGLVPSSVSELVLHGHEHRDLRGELPGPSGPIPVIGAGSATYEDQRPDHLDRRARYNIYSVSGTASTGFALSITQRVHDPKSDRFIPYTPPS